MKIISKMLLNCSVWAMMPVLANAAGTYYNGMYQSPQNRYAQQPYATSRQGYQQQSYQQNQQQRMGTQNYSQQGVSSYNRNQYASAGYMQNNSNVNMQQPMQPNAQNMLGMQQGTDSGFRLGAGFAHQFANWKFNMKGAGSQLHYDNIAWNVLDVNAGFGFDAGKAVVDISGGFKYGMQSGDSTMVDDDISKGGYFITQWGTDSNGDGQIDQVLGDQVGHALSIGTSRDGKMMDLNAGIGLKNLMKIGNLKITPSVGWRYLKYELQTQDNYGMSLDTYTGEGGCITVDGEIQCDTVLIFYDSAGNKYLAHRTDNSTQGGSGINEYDEIPVPSGYDKVNAGSTYYYAQSGISHKYEVEWSGPYIGLDMLYDINQTNYVNAYVELGFPSYTATGDQPYRFDWAHPKSVEDKADMGAAMHLGLGANWSTMISDNIGLTIGMTYDYYSVSDADAYTYLNEGYYMGIYNSLLADWTGSGKGDEAAMLNPTTGNQTAIAIKQLEKECPGWVCSAAGEIESFYKSLGVRVGLNAKF